MFRRVLTATALMLCVGAPLLAAERATFVMTDGERKSGTVVFHGSQGNNVIDDQFNLGLDGKEESYPVSRVAVIDFAGGQPTDTERQALAKDQSNILAFRDGRVEVGRFLNLVNGQTVVWRNGAGAQINLPITEVSRIYLNVPSARIAYGVQPASNAASASAQATPGSVRVDGNVAWVSAGIVVTPFKRVAFKATGDVNVAPGASAGPAGTDALRGNYPVKTAGAGALIGRIGNSGTPFVIGSNTQPISMPGAGPLMLGINDDYLGDNSGFFTVMVDPR